MAKKHSKGVSRSTQCKNTLTLPKHGLVMAFWPNTLIHFMALLSVNMWKLSLSILSKICSENWIQLNSRKIWDGTSWIFCLHSLTNFTRPKCTGLLWCTFTFTKQPADIFLVTCLTSAYQSLMLPLWQIHLILTS